TDPTVDSQVVTLQGAGCNALLIAATPKAAAQAMRKVFDLNWKPTMFVSNVAISLAVLAPLGLEKATGIISSAYLMDPNDPQWKDDAGMTEYRAFMKKYMPDSEAADPFYVYAFSVSSTLVQVLKQCGNDFSRENIMKQAASLTNFKAPLLLP